jgi:hypothetical protein
MQLQPRQEAWEYGVLPLHALCPQLDSQATLIAMHKRLLTKGVTNVAGQREFFEVFADLAVSQR